MRQSAQTVIGAEHTVCQFLLRNRNGKDGVGKCSDKRLECGSAALAEPHNSSASY